MTRTLRVLGRTQVQIFQQDASRDYLRGVRRAGIVAVDTETSGLDWRADRIALCQLFTPTQHAAIIKVARRPPTGMISVLLDPKIRKVFHHAMFDLRFMAHHWDVIAKNVACTKIASKLLDVRGAQDHSLKAILWRHLRVPINKTERLSDWFSPSLTTEQIEYAVEDVRHLIDLLHKLESRLRSRRLLELAHSCFGHIGTKVQLEILGYGDVYEY